MAVGRCQAPHDKTPTVSRCLAAKINTQKQRRSIRSLTGLRESELGWKEFPTWHDFLLVGHETKLAVRFIHVRRHFGY